VTGPAWILLGVAAVAAVTDWVAVARGIRRVEYVVKPMTLAALVGVALALDPASVSMRLAFVVALLFSLAGDVFLMLPRERFVAGLVAFLCAHLSYVIGFATVPGSARRLVVGATITTIVAVPLGVRLVRAVRRTMPALVAPVTAYVGVISTMVAVATGWAAAVAVAGAWSFYASDALIGETRFVRPVAHGALAVIVTYHVGQAALVVSLVG
jgi:uncharacterized membrane protein YhhN